jgi:hypothetical protein
VGRQIMPHLPNESQGLKKIHIHWPTRADRFFVDCMIIIEEITSTIRNWKSCIFIEVDDVCISERTMASSFGCAQQFILCVIWLFWQRDLYLL